MSIVSFLSKCTFSDILKILSIIFASETNCGLVESISLATESKIRQFESNVTLFSQCQCPNQTKYRLKSSLLNPSQGRHQRWIQWFQRTTLFLRKALTFILTCVTYQTHTVSLDPILYITQAVLISIQVKCCCYRGMPLLGFPI